jgi:hypothetical protein
MTMMDAPNPNLVYPACPYCSGEVVPVQDVLVRIGDSGMSLSDMDREWLFTGNQCFKCEERISGTYMPVELQV